MEEEVLDKYKFAESKRGAFKDRGDPLKWKKVRRDKRYKIRKWVEEGGGEGAVSGLLGKNFLLVQRIQFKALAKQARGANRGGGHEAATKGGHHGRSDKENLIKRKHGCQKPLVGLGAACEGL